MKNKVFLIDDDAIICEIVPEMFEVFDVEVLVAQNKEDAINVFTENHTQIKMILFDMNLHGATGIDIYKELIKISNDFISILATGDDVRKGDASISEVDFHEIVQKPFTLATLKELVGKYF